MLFMNSSRGTPRVTPIQINPLLTALTPSPGVFRRRGLLFGSRRRRGRERLIGGRRYFMLRVRQLDASPNEIYRVWAPNLDGNLTLKPYAVRDIKL